MATLTTVRLGDVRYLGVAVHTLGTGVTGEPQSGCMSVNSPARLSRLKRST